MNRTFAETSAVTVRLLGRPRILASDGQAIPVPGRKPLALLAFLAQSPGGQASRGTLATLLWGDRDDEHARNNLRQTLSVLKTHLAPYVSAGLVSGGDILRLSKGVISFDTHRFHALDHNNHAELEEGAALYDGPFLDGLSTGSAEFEEWARRERDRLARIALGIFERLARTGDTGRRTDNARRLLAIDPFREASHRHLMDCFAAAGDFDLALKQYDVCKDLLRKELGVAPDRETEHLREQILRFRKTRSVSSSRPVSLAERTTEAANARVSLGLLKFITIGGGTAAEVLAEGLAQDLIAEFSADREITVRAGSSADHPAGTPAASGHNARTGVTFLLSGSIQPTRDGLRVNAKLIDAVSGDHVWAERFDGDGSHDFQAQASGLIVSAVRLELLLGKFNLRDKAPPDNPSVRRIINQAVVCFFQQSRESVTQAMALAEQALAVDPGSIRARRTLSAAISASITLGALPRTPENLGRALALAQEVVLAVPYDEIARCELAWALTNAERHHEAADQLRQAISLNPASPNARADLAEQLAILGQPAEALHEVQQAFALSGYDPLEIWRHSATAMSHLLLGQYAEALDICRPLVRAEPGFVRGAVYWAAAAAALDRAEEAGRAIDHLKSVAPGARLSNLAPDYVPRFVNGHDHARLIDMLRKAELPE